MKEIRLEGAADGKKKNSIISQEVQTLTLPGTRSQIHGACTATDTHRIFQFAIRPSVVNSLHVRRLHRSLCVWHQSSAPAIKSQISL